MGRRPQVEHLDGVAEVCTLPAWRAIRPDGAARRRRGRGARHIDGSFTAAQAEAFALALLEAVRRLDQGLAGTPADPAVLAALPEPWSPRDHHANHNQQGDETHG